MKLARTLSSLCVACVLTQFIGAGAATQPAAPLTEADQLKQRIAQLEAEVADLRAKLDRATKADVTKGGISFKDELKIDFVPPPPPAPRDTSMLRVGGIGNARITEVQGGTTVPATRAMPKVLQRPAGDLIDERPKPAPNR